MNIYRCLPVLIDKLTNPTCRALGTLGEYYARLQFEKAGYLVSNTHHDHRGDLLVVDQSTGEMLKVEVKTARRGKDKAWNWTLYKHGRTDYRDSDYVLLQAVLKNGAVELFLIPVAQLGERSKIMFRTHPKDYSGQWARYRVRGKLVLGVGYEA